MPKNLNNLLKRKGPLAENEVKDLLKAYNIKTTNYKLVNTEDDLKNLGLKFPVALKVCSSKILHKTDVGGVKLGIKDESELKKTFKDFKKKFPKEKLLVDQMEEKLRTDIKSVIVFTPKINVLPPNGIPQEGLKAKRVVDNRRKI